MVTVLLFFDFVCIRMMDCSEHIACEVQSRRPQYVRLFVSISSIANIVCALLCTNIGVTSSLKPRLVRQTRPAAILIAIVVGIFPSLIEVPSI